MKKCVYDKTKENVAKALGLANFSDAAGMSEENRKAMILKAQKKLKIKSRRKIQNLSSGNPYIMLGRKVNSEGKRVK